MPMDLTSTERDHYVAATMRPDGMVAASRVLELLETICALRAEIADVEKERDAAQESAASAECRAGNAEMDLEDALRSLKAAAKTVRETARGLLAPVTP